MYRFSFNLFVENFKKWKENLTLIIAIIEY